MQYHDIRFLGSAANRTQWPVSELPEVIFAGRSNAGKSSLINSLTNRKNVAYAGKTPGKTKLLNFFEVDRKIVFTDAPGYGYAQGGTRSVLSFAGILEPYFRDREQLAGMVIVLDTRRVPNDDDIAMVEYARQNHLPVIAACVKCDKLSYSQQLKSIKTICRVLGISESSAFAASNLKRTGIDKIGDAIARMAGIEQPE